MYAHLPKGEFEMLQLNKTETVMKSLTVQYIIAGKNTEIFTIVIRKNISGKDLLKHKTQITCSIMTGLTSCA